MSEVRMCTNTHKKNNNNSGQGISTTYKSSLLSSLPLPRRHCTLLVEVKVLYKHIFIRYLTSIKR